MTVLDENGDDLLTPAEVARMFKVDAKTVTRWDKNGVLPASLRTLGGHRRYTRRDVEAAKVRAARRMGDIDDDTATPVQRGR